MARRRDWTSLDGLWAFAIDPRAEWRSPEDARFDRQIEVPFAPETPRSGIGDPGLYRACWYGKRLALPEIDGDEQLFLRFGAVDYACTVWVDGKLAGSHSGGYTPFSVELAVGPGQHTVVVRAEDDPADLAKPRGKQDWQLDPHSIWYPRTTGIWQSVWLERVPRSRIEGVRWTPSVERWALDLDARILADCSARLWLVVRLRMGDALLVDDRFSVISGHVRRRLALSDPGIDDFRNELLWSPESPKIIEAELELCDETGRVLDSVSSYTALRAVATEGDRFVLNGRTYPLRLVLDQGYWPETGMTAPDDEALRRDVLLAKAMGFNGARKHQKIEDPRYLYWADRLGLLVWEEMPSAYRFTRQSIVRVTREWMDVLDRDASHPCIVAWVPFNESWGVPNLPGSKPERHYVEAVYHLTKTLDPTRPVVGNDGWESVATDIVGIHDYDADPSRVAARYATPDLLPRILKRERPGGRALVLDHERFAADLPIVLSEFGGIACSSPNGNWGYSWARSASDFGERYERLMSAVGSLELFCGFCYTQLTDTYQEANGLLYADRTPKVPLEAIAAATLGVRADRADASVPPADANVTERAGAPR
jgi:beta-galactosidase/beta-glucuronidase